MRLKLLAAAAILSSIFSAGAHASPITYTFSGNVAVETCTLCDGSDTSSPISGLFNLSILSDTSLVDNSGLPFSRLDNASGAFSLGALSATLTGIHIVSTASPINRINFFNAVVDNGLGFGDPAFNSYDLTQAIGPLTNAAFTDLTPTFGGGFFDVLGGGGIGFIRDADLTFSATTGVPEPITLSLFGAGIAGLAAARRRKNRKA